MSVINRLVYLLVPHFSVFINTVERISKRIILKAALILGNKKFDYHHILVLLIRFVLSLACCFAIVLIAGLFARINIGLNKTRDSQVIHAQPVVLKSGDERCLLLS